MEFIVNKEKIIKPRQQAVIPKGVSMPSGVGKDVQGQEQGVPKGKQQGQEGKKEELV